MSRKKNSESKKSRKRQNRKSNSSRSESMNQMKYEIANEFGVNLGPEASSRCKGTVGGEMTKRLANRSSRKKSK